jgi:hypothetical protein
LSIQRQTQKHCSLLLSSLMLCNSFKISIENLGAEIEMTIRGDTLLYKNAVGGVGTIRSEIFTKALCDTFYGSDPVSPTHKASVLVGIPNL